MPGLNVTVLRKVADKLKLMWHGQMVNLSPEQWIAFEDGCRVEIGLPADWKEAAYLECHTRAKHAGWTTRYGPGAPGGWRRKEKSEYVESIKIADQLDVSGTLFE